ncbi:bifunctional metallophosphatase/5'-nucleotidase [Bradyrhizobium sp. UASWS1016]|jgi:2',3'-cyclic-nucleotide 2'-phosphodiesterase (5'-nucleotidase family)|uniref:Bifunctional metallophosphatase/5'-nucleotidase n=3 Tax=Nitrobacteraceae TaxID=41294 RepID=A0A5P6PGR6_9BRAD|nr:MULTISPECIES: bifunctional metallophosphatase/5'-nucleotidase [Bradyrhizobium]MCS3730919.1 2',3'-cyclic-nucleotide 2'-phosphodiesterase (5'-nucleotidase family) [Bradyrhizobium betae]OCX32572.1 bifunctional metallophosphatase/5'-nucleotidase [Bradyrhizobium sp. UASWS1016]OYU86495.1 MAG: bifunctional metallophosphatase/5'-nucleotidase [Bradyrhizobiaceae bacterium PARB1]QFI77592.1 bifunctional metallophosphatase/5'-nucleotidase [Bradyrhizobium betae]
MDARNLTIIQVNDTHGYLEAHPELMWHGDTAAYPIMGGYARIASILKGARAEGHGSVLALDNGDTFHGTYPVVSSKGAALVPLVNALGFDAMTAHWEFAWGPRHWRALSAQLNHPMLAINCYDVETGELYFPASIVIERGGLRVGIIGIAATIIDKSMPPYFSEGVRFTSGCEELPAEISRLRNDEGAELIVVLSHLGLPQDIRVAHVVKDIDVIVSGHTHNRLEQPARIGNTLIIQSGCHGSFVGRLDLTVADGKIAGWRHRLIPVDQSIADDAEMSARIEGVMKPHREMLNEVVGQTAVGLHRDTNLYAPMDDLLLAAIATAGDTDIAFSNGWRYGAPIPPGLITMNDLWNIIPTNPPVSTVDLTGTEIQEMMEKNLERTFSADPFGQMGGYLKRFRGLTIYGKLENPPGQRIEHIFRRGAPVLAGETYRAAFVTAQGVPKQFGRNRRDLPVRAIQALVAYLKESKAGTKEGIGRFIAA